MPSLVGYTTNKFYQNLISDENLTRLQKKITNELKNVHPLQIPIIVNKKAIENVVNSVYESKFRENIGDMYSRNHQQREDYRCDFDLINQQTFKNIVSSVKSDIAQQDTYKNLNVWTSEENKQRYPSVKLNNKVKSASIPQRF